MSEVQHSLICSICIKNHEDGLPHGCHYIPRLSHQQIRGEKNKIGEMKPLSLLDQIRFYQSHREETGFDECGFRDIFFYLILIHQNINLISGLESLLLTLLSHNDTDLYFDFQKNLLSRLQSIQEDETRIEKTVTEILEATINEYIRRTENNKSNLKTS